jgi:ABC-type multidrug transport system fused ATPase/permease subunit
VNSTEQFLFLLGMLVFILLIFSLIFKALTTYAQTRFALMREYSIGKRLVEGYLHQPYSWFLNRHSADLGKNILSEVGNVISGALVSVMTLMSQVTVTIALLVLLVVVDPLLAISVGLVLGVAYGGILALVSGWLNRLGQARIQANQERYTVLSEAFGAAKEVKVGGLESDFIRRFNKPAESYAKGQSTAQVITQMPRFALEAIAFGGMLLVILYLMQTIFRDFRDNFSVELFGFYGFTDKSQFVSMEFIIGLTVVFTTSLIVIFKNNLWGFQASLILSGLGFVMMLVAELLFGSGQINFFYLMLFSGLGMSIGYVPFQIALLERFIAAFHIAGNVGFLMYISDSLGYLGSVSILFSKNAGLINIDNVALFHMLILGCGIIGLIATIFSIFYFNVKFIKEKNEIH